MDSGARRSLGRKRLLSARSLRCTAAPLSLRVATGEIMEGGPDAAEISPELVPYKQLSRPRAGSSGAD